MVKTKLGTVSHELEYHMRSNIDVVNFFKDQVQ